jgi:hypothetical protein
VQLLNRVPLDSDVANLLDRMAADYKQAGSRLDVHAVVNEALRAFLNKERVEASLADRMLALEEKVESLYCGGGHQQNG